MGAAKNLLGLAGKYPRRFFRVGFAIKTKIPPPRIDFSWRGNFVKPGQNFFFKTLKRKQSHCGDDRGWGAIYCTLFPFNCFVFNYATLFALSLTPIRVHYILTPAWLGRWGGTMPTPCADLVLAHTPMLVYGSGLATLVAWVATYPTVLPVPLVVPMLGSHVASPWVRGPFLSPIRVHYLTPAYIAFPLR